MPLIPWCLAERRRFRRVEAEVQADARQQCTGGKRNAPSPRQQRLGGKPGAVKRKARLAISVPAATSICTHEPYGPRLAASGCSTAISMAPPIRRRAPVPGWCAASAAEQAPRYRLPHSWAAVRCRRSHSPSTGAKPAASIYSRAGRRSDRTTQRRRCAQDTRTRTCQTRADADERDETRKEHLVQHERGCRREHK
ncbi:hypothetical protein DM48_7372 [Burkholderia gladioli]|uniref:Uncharacterized protein n=1 Tax=Burkholderia gladioli TaxID=28095 RepID=A0AAW3EVM5_BURGA|nr:hypothetical protein DM48_7372 [Burkholderia gladioli]